MTDPYAAAATDPAAATAAAARYAGVLSAVGIHLADIVQESQEPAAAELSSGTMRQLAERLDALQAVAVKKLQQQGFEGEQINVERFLNLR